MGRTRTDEREEFGDTFASSKDSGHREIADGVYQIQECIVKSPVYDRERERMLEWCGPGAELHAAQNAYLVRGEQSLLYDTLTPAGREGVLRNLDEILGDDGLDYVVISHPEANHAGNVGAIRSAYPEATLVVARYGVHHELFDVGDDAMLVGDGDVIDLGGREITFRTPTFFDHAMTVFMTDSRTDTAFTADWFGFEHAGADCLAFADEQSHVADAEHDVAFGQLNRFQGYAFTWFRYADVAKTDARIDRFADEVDPAMIAPAHGCPIRRDVGAHLELMKSVIRDIAESGADYRTHTHGQILLNKGPFAPGVGGDADD